jgi:hypothetical protein
MDPCVNVDPYPRLRRRLAFVRARLRTRAVCDLIAIERSTTGRLLGILMLGAVLFACVLGIGFALSAPALVVIISAFAVFSTAVTLGTTLVLWGRDNDLIALQQQLVEQLPAAKAAWDVSQERLRAQQAARLAAEKQRQQTERNRERVEQTGTAAQAYWQGPGTFDVEVVGESYHQSELETICGGRTASGAHEYVTALLVLDDANPYDSQAVKVVVSGYQVGHLSREGARAYRRMLSNEGHPRAAANCAALIVGGWERSNGDRGHFGVRLDLPR